MNKKLLLILCVLLGNTHLGASTGAGEGAATMENIAGIDWRRSYDPDELITQLKSVDDNDDEGTKNILQQIYLMMFMCKKPVIDHSDHARVISDKKMKKILSSDSVKMMSPQEFQKTYERVLKVLETAKGEKAHKILLFVMQDAPNACLVELHNRRCTYLLLMYNEGRFVDVEMQDALKSDEAFISYLKYLHGKFLTGGLTRTDCIHLLQRKGQFLALFWEGRLDDFDVRGLLDEVEMKAGDDERMAQLQENGLLIDSRPATF